MISEPQIKVEGKQIQYSPCLMLYVELQLSIALPELRTLELSISDSTIFACELRSQQKLHRTKAVKIPNLFISLLVISTLNAATEWKTTIFIANFLSHAKRDTSVC